ncbi:MAG: hypothetical protein WBM71_11975 [Sedimenticolaceae bacterium]
MSKLLICNARMVNEGQVREGDLLVVDGRIDQIGADITAPPGAQVIDAAGQVLMPGMIDDQVHFREPGVTHKGDLATESHAAIAGGITSYMEMPNTNPQTVTLERLEEKYGLARGRAWGNLPSTWVQPTTTSTRSGAWPRIRPAVSRSSWGRRPGTCWSTG